MVWSDGHYGPDGTMQDVVTFRDSVSDPMYAYLQLKVGYGSVKIIKTSEDGEVSGISFTVSGNGTEQTVMTNADGEMQLDDLRPGVYTVTEQSDDRYEPHEVRQVTVISGQIATVTFHNTLKRGSLEVVKTAEDGLNEGVKFHLTGTSLAGLPVDEWTNGRWHSSAPARWGNSRRIGVWNGWNSDLRQKRSSFLFHPRRRSVNDDVSRTE